MHSDTSIKYLSPTLDNIWHHGSSIANSICNANMLSLNPTKDCMKFISSKAGRTATSIRSCNICFFTLDYTQCTNYIVLARIPLSRSEPNMAEVFFLWVGFWMFKFSLDRFIQPTLLDKIGHPMFVLHKFKHPQLFVFMFMTCYNWSKCPWNITYIKMCYDTVAMYM